MKKRVSIAFLLFLLLAVSACAANPGTAGDASQQTASESETESQTIREPQERSEAQATMEPQERSEPQAITEPSERDVDSAGQEKTAMRISVKSEQYEIIYELNGSTAADGLYAQLPLTTEVEPFSDNEMTFYPEKLDVTDTPLSGGEPGSLSYYEPWGDVVLFYAPCAPNGSLYELGKAERNISSI